MVNWCLKIYYICWIIWFSFLSLFFQSFYLTIRFYFLFCICLCACELVYKAVCVSFMSIYVCIYPSMSICVYIYFNEYFCVWVSLNECFCVCACVWVGICVFTCVLSRPFTYPHGKEIPEGVLCLSRQSGIAYYVAYLSPSRLSPRMITRLIMLKASTISHEWPLISLYHHWIFSWANMRYLSTPFLLLSHTPSFPSHLCILRNIHWQRSSICWIANQNVRSFRKCHQSALPFGLWVALRSAPLPLDFVC